VTAAIPAPIGAEPVPPGLVSSNSPEPDLNFTKTDGYFDVEGSPEDTVATGSRQIPERSDQFAPAPQSGTLILRVRLHVNNDDNAHYGASADDKPVRFAKAELFDREGGGVLPPVLLATAYLNGSAEVEFSVPNDDGALEGGLDPFVRFHTTAQPTGQPTNNTTERYKLLNASTLSPFIHEEAWPDDLPAGVHQRNITLNGAPAFHIMSRLAVGYIQAVSGGVVFPRNVTAYWTSGYVPAAGMSFYSNGRSEIHIQDLPDDADQWDADVIIRLFGYHALDALYDGDWPASIDAANHPYGQCLHPNSAWALGFTIFFQAAAQGNRTYEDARDPANNTFRVYHNLEPLVPGNESICQEFSVAGALWDVFDAANDDDPGVPGGDGITAGADEIWDILRHYRPSGKAVATVNEFHVGWGPGGRNHADHGLVTEVLREHGQLRGLMTSNVLRQWLMPTNFAHGTVIDRANRTGLEPIVFGVPLSQGSTARQLTADFLRAAEPRPAIVQIPSSPFDNIEALHQDYAFINDHSNVILVVGMNEPLSQSNWAVGTPASTVQDHIRREHSSWHNVSALPFCHKFTSPDINVPGLDFAAMRAMWNATQDHVCYDLYFGTPTNDTMDRLDMFRLEANNRSMAVHILETYVGDGNHSTFQNMSERIFTGRLDTISAFHFLERCTSVSANVCEGGTVHKNKSAWWYDTQAGTWTERAQATMLRSLLCPCPG
jgi:hypothetical protein